MDYDSRQRNPYRIHVDTHFSGLLPDVKWKVLRLELMAYAMNANNLPDTSTIPVIRRQKCEERKTNFPGEEIGGKCSQFLAMLHQI